MSEQNAAVAGPSRTESEAAMMSATPGRDTRISGTDRPQRWAVLGAGMLGMTIALRLQKLGHSVTLLEARPNIGGLADSWKLGDVTWDRHYHVTLMSDFHIRSLLKELDIESELEWVETRTGFYTDGQLHSMSNTVEFLRFPPLGLIDKLRLGGTIFYASKVRDWESLEKQSVEDWLTRLSGRRTFEKIWKPLLRAKLGDCWQDTSAAFIWATIARMYAARRSGLKKEMFGYVRGGYARINDVFRRRLREAGVDIRCGMEVREIHSHSDGRITVATLDEQADYDRVVSTLPSTAVTRLMPQLPEEEWQLHNGIRYHGIVCASVLLKNKAQRSSPDPDLKHSGLSPYYVTNITDPAPFTAVIDMSALVRPEHLNERGLIYLPKYVTPDDPTFERSDESLREEFIEALDRMYPHFSAEDVMDFRVSRVRNVFALPTQYYSQRLPPIRTGIPGVSAVNSAHIVNGTLNVNETVRLAEEFVEEHVCDSASAAL